MSVNTENKRRSAAPQLPYLMVMPIPDGGIGAQDRRHVAGIYCAILVVASVLVRTFTVKRLVQDTGRKIKILWDS